MKAAVEITWKASEVGANDMGRIGIRTTTSLPIKINQIWVNIRYTCGFARFVVPIFRKVLLGYEVIFLGGLEEGMMRRNELFLKILSTRVRGVGR